MKIAVFFPGIGYTCDKPLLYYSRTIANERGFDKLINISYKTDVKLDVTNIESVAAILYKQAESELESVVWSEYDEIVFFAKSIGTVIACEYAFRHQISPKQVLFTPLSETYEHNPKNAIAFSGTKDQWTDHREVVRKSREMNIPIYVTEGANHSLECKLLPKDIDIIKEVINLVIRFIDENQTNS